MSTNRPSSMTEFLQKRYNKLEKFLFYCFLVVLIFINALFVLEDNEVSKAYAEYSYQDG
jgi:hypothetical protein